MELLRIVLHDTVRAGVRTFVHRQADTPVVISLEAGIRCYFTGLGMPTSWFSKKKKRKRGQLSISFFHMIPQKQTHSDAHKTDIVRGNNLSDGAPITVVLVP